jgi:Carboxypeptidase regulatory-like domain
MKYQLTRMGAVVFALLATAAMARAQVAATGSLAGTVTDQQTAVVAGASVTVKNDATAQEFTATTSDNGTFNVPSLAAGTYTVTITSQGFKQAVVPDVKIAVGTPSSISVALEVGAPTEIVTVTAAGGGEILQTQSATVGTTITGRQIIEQPQASRDALDLVTLLPGVQTTGRPRTSTANGLPRGALNITIDGTNVQDNLIRSQDGFFTYVRPRVDAIDEVTLSTATPGAESAGEGAIQIKFITRSGTNDLTGSLYWYHRNPALNANYYFNNLSGTPRARILLNQYGGRVGGPIRIPGLFDGRDKAFFFVNYEEYRLPEQQFRQRNVLSPSIFGGATPGNFQYTAGGVTNTVNLLSLAAANGEVSTVDPVVAGALNAIRGTFAQGSLAAIPGAPNFERFSFNGIGGQERYFPTVRLDWNVTQNHHVENIWNYQRFTGRPVDFLNNADPSFPGFPNSAGQDSHRFTNTTALRSTLSASLVNEARFGLAGGNSLFGANVSRAQFANQGGFDLGFSDSVNANVVLTDVTANGFPGQGGLGIFGNTSSRRNTPAWNFSDTLTWVRGQHSFNFGGSWTQINSYQFDLNQVAPTVFFGFGSEDTAAELFTTGNFPGASDAQLAEAAQLYALLTGRLAQVYYQAFLNESGQYGLLGDQTTRFRQREFGFFGQDSWRVRPNLTLNYGLRWEPQQSPVSLNNAFTKVDFPQIFGVSQGRGLFNPGTLPGATPTQLTALEPGEKLYNTDWNNFAPSVGFAYSPDWKSGLLNRLFGDGGQSVLRAGYSLAYVREGLSLVITPIQGNTGGIIAVPLTVDSEFPAGTLLRDAAGIGLPTFPATPTFPVQQGLFDAASAFDPNLRTGYVQSWTASFQRELDRNTVFEARYVGTRGIKLARRYNINEVNVIENGFLNEFRLAQGNLAANRAAGRGNTFAYFGPGTGTSPLPILVGAFSSVPAAQAGNPALYTSAQFSAAANVATLAATNPNPLGLAGTLSNVLNPFAARLTAAGYPANIFLVNPDAQFGGAFITDNGQQTWYDGMQIELRRRMAQGLLLQANYTWSKSQTNWYPAATGSQTATNNYVTLRDLSLSKRLSPYDIRHAFKVNWIYELPFGRGKTFLDGASGLTDHLLGGWEFHGTARVQSGRPFRLGNIQLVGMTADELQDAVEIRKDPSGTVFFLPDDIILNTRRAFNTSATTATGYSALGVPEGRFIAPAGFGNCAQSFVGSCGFSDLVLHGPRFVRVDMSVVKKIRFTERTNLELRGEFLNAINNINFFVGGSASTDAAAVTNFNSALFGTTTFAYQDTSTTNDPGGRLVQFVLRFNF